ncbi:MAG: tyrosine-type recombinase/integrase [Lentisphaeria bacterium]|nr:tyrosine-type recombinase/integrase [Lentisphaeria bacterium]
MKKYLGSIIKRGDTYHWRYKTITGKFTTRAVKTETGSKITNFSEAERIVVKWSSELFVLNQIKTREETIQKIAEVKSLLKVCRVPLAELEDAFFAHPSAPTISPKHRQTYHSVLNSLTNFASQLHVETVADVTEEVAQAFLTYYWSRGISPKTYNSVLDILRCVFRLMNKDSNPFAGFKKKICQTEERVAFTVEQLQQIWKTLTSPDFHMMHKDEMIVLYKLALYTGARCGDLCLLRWSSVDLQNRVIRFMPHKTSHSSRKIVEIPVGAVLYEALSSLDQTAEYVLPHVADRYQYNSGGISHDTRKLLIAAGLKPNDPGTSRRLLAVSRMGFHGFRHTAASLMISNGVNPLVVRDLLGHTSVEMTARYTHVALDTKINAVKALPVLGKISSQETTLEEVISSLPAEQTPRLAACLKAILTPSQQEELLAGLRE